MGYNVDYLGAIAAIEEGLRGFECLPEAAYNYVKQINKVVIFSGE